MKPQEFHCPICGGLLEDQGDRFFCQYCNRKYDAHTINPSGAYIPPTVGGAAPTVASVVNGYVPPQIHTGKGAEKRKKKNR